MEKYHGLRRKEKEIKCPVEMNAVLARVHIGRIDLDFLSGKRSEKEIVSL